MALAGLNVLEHLVLAIFDATPNKRRATEQFVKTTEGTNVEMLYSTMPEGFLAEFEFRRKVLLTLLTDAARAPPSSQPDAY